MNMVRIVIFAKAPLPGFAKTRLIPALGATGAASLAADLLKHTVEQALAADIGPVELCVTPSVHDPIWHKLALPAGIKLTEQGAGDLGDRKTRVSRRVIDADEALLIIGTDCPQLDSTQLKLAATVLRSADACLIPASDGGYCLIGLRQFHPFLFENMPWSTDKVAAITRRRVKSLGWSIRELQKLHDIDEPKDLIHIPPTWHTSYEQYGMLFSQEGYLSNGWL